MCFVYHDDGPKFFEQYTRTARKRHRCCECHQLIHPGERYEYSAGKWDEFRDFATCLRCVRLREAVVAVERAHGCGPAESSPAFECLFSDVEDWPEYADEFLRRGWADAYLLVPPPDPDDLFEDLARDGYENAVCDRDHEPGWDDLGGEGG
jgi:hypothetical protein